MNNPLRRIVDEIDYETVERLSTFGSWMVSVCLAIYLAVPKITKLLLDENAVLTRPEVIDVAMAGVALIFGWKMLTWNRRLE